MADIIRVSPEKLISSAGVFETTANEVKSLTTNMTGTVQAMTGRIWSGEAQAAYTSKFNGLQGDINKLHQMIIKASTDMKTIANEFIKIEEQNKEQGSHLSSNPI